MAAVSLFWNTNVAAVTSRENALFVYISINSLLQIETIPVCLFSSSLGELGTAWTIGPLRSACHFTYPAGERV